MNKLNFLLYIFSENYGLHSISDNLVGFSKKYVFVFISDSVKKLQDQKHDMEREIKTLHRRLRVSTKFNP